MKGKELLKKIFYGKLIPLTEEIEEDICEYRAPERISSDTPNFEYKVIYAVARVGWIKAPVKYASLLIGMNFTGQAPVKCAPLLICMNFTG